uniref:Selenoprotein K n=1 Tax=Cyprinus carpio carpio TaxID=630221 RepID=A0A9J7Y9Q6_CYPCA
MVYVSNGQVLDSRTRSPWSLSFLSDLFWGAVEFIGFFFFLLLCKKEKSKRAGYCAVTKFINTLLLVKKVQNITDWSVVINTLLSMCPRVSQVIYAILIKPHTAYRLGLSSYTAILD